MEMSCQLFVFYLGGHNEAKLTRKEERWEEQYVGLR